jgi:hypothetical protein
MIEKVEAEFLPEEKRIQFERDVEVITTKVAE